MTDLQAFYNLLQENRYLCSFLSQKNTKWRNEVLKRYGKDNKDYLSFLKYLKEEKMLTSFLQSKDDTWLEFVVKNLCHDELKTFKRPVKNQRQLRKRI